LQFQYKTALLELLVYLQNVPLIESMSQPIARGPSPIAQFSWNRILDLDTLLNVDDDLLDDLGRGVEAIRRSALQHDNIFPIGYSLNQSLVESHLEGVPGLGTLTTGGLSGGDLESLGWETDGALDTEILALGALNELLADLLEGSDLSAGQGDADLVSFLGSNC